MDGDIVKTEVAPVIKTEIKMEDNDQNNVVKSVECKIENVAKEVDSENAKNEDVVEEDDVPSDFFDDFMNKEFMDALDVVVPWDKDEDKEEEKKLCDAEKRQDASLRRSRDNRRASDLCGKPETGLVPPGMETEVDLKEIKKQEALSNEKLRNDRNSEKESNEKSENSHNFGKEKPRETMKDKMQNAIRYRREKLRPKQDIRNSRERGLPPGSNSRERRTITRHNYR